VNQVFQFFVESEQSQASLQTFLLFPAPAPNPQLHPRSRGHSLFLLLSTSLLAPPNAVPSFEIRAPSSPPLKDSDFAPGSLFPPLRNLHRALVFTLRELGGGRSSVKSTSVLDLALARRARPEFGGEGLSVVLVTERLAGFPFPALSFPPYPLLLATLQLLLHRGNS